jgi:hypothetical protein
MFYESNQRNVSPRGVDFVMRAFFDGLRAKYGAEHDFVPAATTEDDVTPEARKQRRRERRAKRGSEREGRTDDDVVCEDEMLEAFGPDA